MSYDGKYPSIPCVSETKEELIRSFAGHLALQRYKKGGDETFTDMVDRLKLVGKMQIKHVPHLYKGGWVIPNFGWSTERIPYNAAKMTSVEEGFGNPLLVGDWD